MKSIIIYWSQTGNTQAMAEYLETLLSQKGDTQLYSVDQAPSDISEYDVVALGCPAMGSETLEDGEFEPYYESIAPSLSGKKVVLFGSYDWGDGEWMRNWEANVIDNGGEIVGSSLIFNLTPDESAFEEAEKIVSHI